MEADTEPERRKRAEEKGREQRQAGVTGSGCVDDRKCVSRVTPHGARQRGCYDSPFKCCIGCPCPQRNCGASNPRREMASLPLSTRCVLARLLYALIYISSTFDFPLKRRGLPEISFPTVKWIEVKLEH